VLAPLNLDVAAHTPPAAAAPVVAAAAATPAPLTVAAPAVAAAVAAPAPRTAAVPAAAATVAAPAPLDAAAAAPATLLLFFPLPFLFFPPPLLLVLLLLLLDGLEPDGPRCPTLDFGDLSPLVCDMSTGERGTSPDSSLIVMGSPTPPDLGGSGAPS
jgi:hypothetical protein